MFNWWCTRRNIFPGDLLVNRIDIHTHLLPGVDDGTKTEEEALAILQLLATHGVKKVFCTPHVMTDLVKNRSGYLKARFREFQKLCPVNIELRLAAEYMLDEHFLYHLKDGLLAFDKKHVLLETSYLDAPPNMERLLYETTLYGYQPILAHPERYLYMEPENYTLLKERNCKFQLNLLSVAGYYGKEVQYRSKDLLRKGYYDFIGSDIHHLKQYKSYYSVSLPLFLIKTLKALIRKNEELWI